MKLKKPSKRGRKSSWFNMKKENYPNVTRVLPFSKIKDDPLLLRECTGLIFVFDKQSLYYKYNGFLKSFYWDSNCDKYLLEFKSSIGKTKEKLIYISSTDNLKLLLKHCDVVAAPQQEHSFFIDCLL